MSSTLIIAAVLGAIVIAVSLTALFYRDQRKAVGEPNAADEDQP